MPTYNRIALMSAAVTVGGGGTTFSVSPAAAGSAARYLILHGAARYTSGKVAIFNATTTWTNWARRKDAFNAAAHVAAVLLAGTSCPIDSTVGLTPGTSYDLQALLAPPSSTDPLTSLTMTIITYA
jgi:hypothetical protein